MKYMAIMPARHRLSNLVLRGGPGVQDLECVRYEADSATFIATYYRLTFWQRVRFLFSGEIYLNVMGKTQPPVALGVGDFFEGQK
jgi:hypothetical protein